MHKKRKLRVHVWGTEEDVLFHPFTPAKKALKTILHEHTVSFFGGKDSFTKDTLEDCDILISYLEVRLKGFKPAVTKRIKEFVKNGGGHIVIHSGIIQTDPGYARFIGGEFTEHPAFREIQVKTTRHPITKGIKDFTIADELYLFKGFNKKSEVFVYAMHEGKARPLGWTFSYGKGQVVYLASGHNHLSFSSTQFLQLISNAVIYTTNANTVLE